MKTNSEFLSAFMDGEFSNDDTQSVLDNFPQEEALSELWQRYHLIRDTLNKQLPNLIDPKLSSRINHRLNQLETT